MTAAVLILAFVTLQRLAELWLAERNRKRLLAKGAVEYDCQSRVLDIPAHDPLCVWPELFRPAHDRG